MTEKAKPTTRTARPARRSIGLAPDPFAETTAPATAPEPAPAAAQVTPAKTRRSPSKPATPNEPTAATPPPPVSSPVAAKAEPEMVNTDARPGEEYWGEPTIKLTVNIPASLHRRAAGLLLHQQITGDPAEIRSLTDATRIGLHHVVSRYEKEFNGGEYFAAPKNGPRRGRR